MVKSSEVLDKIREYASGQLDLSAFRFWMVESHLDVQGSKAESQAIDREAARLLATLEFFYAQLSDGLMTEAEWKESVRSLAELCCSSNTRVFAQFCDPVNRRLEAGVPTWAAPSGTSPVVEFGSVLLFQY